jgi:hypothetical protein
VIRAVRRSLEDVFACLRQRSLVRDLSLVAAVVLPIYFTLDTGLIWEDFLITYRFSENLAQGHGLVYNLGERVQGFTSPLNTLLPALFAAVLRSKDFVGPLWGYRIVSLAGLFCGIAAVTGLFTRPGTSPGLRVMIGALFPVVAVLEIKTTAFAMSGQEAGLMIGFLGTAFALAVLGWTRHWALGGLLWAGLMYTRPDGWAEITAVALAALAFPSEPRRALGPALLKSAGVCGLCYLPWLLFTWSYYGSPIPHTIIAKYIPGGFRSRIFDAWAPLQAAFAKAPATLCAVFAPIYDWHIIGPGGWPKPLHDVITSLELVAVLYWAVPSHDRLGRMASFAACLLFAYLLWANLVAAFAPWYFPPLAFLSLLALVSAIATLAGTVRAALLRAAAGVLMMAGLLLVLGFIFSHSLEPLWLKQDVVERRNRQPIGLWLGEHVPAGERVYLEPLGYIGYYSRCRMVDWPGLVSPAVVAVRRKTGRTDYDWADPVAALRPEWLVARPGDLDLLRTEQPDAFARYERAAVFDVSDLLGAAGPYTGSNMMLGEAIFIILRRTKEAARPAAGPG